MAILAKIGTSATTGGQTSLVSVSGFTVERVTSGGRKVDSEELINEDGALLGILIYQRHKLLEFSLVSSSGAASAVETAFPMGAMAAAPLADYYVENCSIESTKSAVRASVTLRDITTPV